ncbi:MAG: HEAT repeat domain-containing protein [Planctomycetes bacterium]|nr:HEAT repeat domain-containing protein [Planctomycetota bacterium]
MASPTMDILFCDLCNESVPVGHLADGRAFRRKGRVVCAACDAAMGGQGAIHDPGDTQAIPVPPSLLAVQEGTPHAATDRAAAPVPRSGRGSAVFAGLALFIAVLALAGGALGMLRLMEESNLQKQNLRDGHAGLDRKLAHLSGRMDGMVAGVAGNLDELETDLTKKFDVVTIELTGKLRELNESLAASRERLASIETTMRAMDADLHATDEELQSRLDTMLVAALEEKQHFAALADRLSALEDLVHSGALVPATTDDELDAGPAWQVALDDLNSEDSAVRWNAVQALAESGDPAVVPHLVPLLEDEDIWVRMAAAGALGDLAAVDAVEPLIRTLEDPETAVRERAMLSLRAITGRSFGFDPGGSESERAKAIKKWRDWWKKASAELAD